MKLIHLSDLHFGTETDDIVTALHRAVKEIQPDYVLISGDFTQVGNEKEFRIAHMFLNDLPCPFLCVPGNHDVPAYDLWERFTNPYEKYTKYISPSLSAHHEDDAMIIGGINSARRAVLHWNWANGAISNQQREWLRNKYKTDDSRWKICMFHHPIHKVDDMPLDVTVFGRKRTLELIQELEIDLVLTGHVHHASIISRGNEEHQTIYLSASTALSSRRRGQENGFNVIELLDDKMIIEIYKMQNSNFSAVEKFEKTKSL